MDQLPLDVLRIILGITSSKDVLNYSMTSKQNLKFQTDTQIWLQFCIERTQFTKDVFVDLVKGDETALRQCAGTFLRYPYNPYHLSKQLVIGGNRQMDVYFVMKRISLCGYLFTRGAKKMQYCNSPTIPGSAYCRCCARKKGVISSNEWSTEKIVL